MRNLTIRELHAIAILDKVIDTLEVYTDTLSISYDDVRRGTLLPIVARRQANAIHNSVNIARYRNIANTLSQGVESDIVERLRVAVGQYYDIIGLF